MQNRVKEKQRLLNEFGSLANPGYSTSPVFEYARKDIKASVWRIKEWDYYAVLNQEYGITFTVADLGYSAMVTVVFLNFKDPKISTKTKLLWFPFGKMNMPESSLKGDIIYRSKDFTIEITRNADKRIIKAEVKNFTPGNDLYSRIEIDDLKEDSMVIATPWKENKRAFYYNQKINCMPSTGEIIIGKDVVMLSKKNTFAVLDWGRGVWTYKNTWYWSSVSGLIGKKRFGVNLGYGFGDTQAATENMLFYDGKSHKIDIVTFQINPNDYMKEWVFKDNNQRLDLVMKPILDRQDHINFGVIKNYGHQVFGLFNGSVVLDDGTKLLIKDMLGFAEKITNHY